MRATRAKLVWIAAAALVAPPAHAAPPADLETYLSYPFPSALTAPERGGRAAWVEMRRGVRTLWFLSDPAGIPRPLTTSAGDDGMELGELAFSPDGRILAWVRGGGEGNGWAADRPAPNPASMPQAPHQEVWVSIDGAAPFKVADGAAPALSATGQLAYLKDDQVWTVALKPDAKPAALFTDRGKIGQLAWSPDGSRLAFVSRRGDHSFVGVYAAPDRPILWLAPSTDYDANPVWSPDGRRIAFSRMEGESDVLASPLTETPHPFSLWVAGADDGEARRLWRSPQTLDGSFPRVPGGLSLMWGAGDRLVFRAELDGWPHLYALPAAGGEPVLLTPGDFTVEHVALTPDRRTLVYDANAGDTPGDIDRRHLFQVAVEQPGPAPLTTGTGVEFTPAALGDGRIAYVGAAATGALRTMSMGLDGRGTRTLGRAPDYTAQLVVPKAVTFKAPDGTTIHGQLFAAPGTAKRPGLVFVHGGPSRQMLLGWSYMDYYAHAYAMNQYFATHGYTVLSVNYRLGIGYGRAFQHPANGGRAGNSEYQDVRAGARFLQAQAGVDPARIGIWGGSYGGLLTAHALAQDSALFKAGVDFHGVHDWSLDPDHMSKPARYEQGAYPAVMKSAFDSSPEAFLKGWTSPVLLIAGDDDRNVRFDQTVDPARRLRAQGTPFETLVLPNEIHGFLRYDSWLRADTAAVRFLGETLKP